MRASSWRATPTLALVLGCAACAANPAPRGWLSPPAQSQADPYGAWIVISTSDDSAHNAGVGLSPSGEFLAVEDDSIFVLLTDGAVQGIPMHSILQARIAWYDSQWRELSLWTFLGSISAISHGFGLILSFPVWVIGGSVAAGGQSRAPLLGVDLPSGWDVVRPYARFPGGLPANLPRTLPPKSWR